MVNSRLENAQELEVELRDNAGKLCLCEKDQIIYDNDIKRFKIKIEEEVGGMLCMDHYRVPKLEAIYLKNRWTIRINCCCNSQLNRIENRLLEQFT